MAANNTLYLSSATCASTPFLDRLAPAMDAGYSGLSMMMGDLESITASGVKPSELRARLADAGLIVTELEGIANWLPATSNPAGPWGYMAEFLSHATAERLCPLAAEYGAGSVLCIEMLHSGLELEAKTEAFSKTCAVAARYGLNVVLEFLPTSGISSLADARKIVEGSDAENGALMLDSWHSFRTNTALKDIAALPARMIGALQISDGPAKPEADLASAMMHSRLLPGEGEMPLADWLAAVRSAGCTAPISVEVISDAIGTMPMAAIAQTTAAAARALYTAEQPSS